MLLPQAFPDLGHHPAGLVDDRVPVVDEDGEAEKPQPVTAGVVVALLLRVPVVGIAVQLHKEAALQLHVEAVTVLVRHDLTREDLYASAGQEA